MVKNLLASTGDAGDPGLIPGSGRYPGRGNGNPFPGKSAGEGNDTSLHYSCLENSVGRGPWWATVHGVAKESDTT